METKQTLIDHFCTGNKMDGSDKSQIRYLAGRSLSGTKTIALASHRLDAEYSKTISGKMSEFRPCIVKAARDLVANLPRDNE